MLLLSYLMLDPHCTLYFWVPRFTLACVFHFRFSTAKTFLHQCFMHVTLWAQGVTISCHCEPAQVVVDLQP